MRITKVSGLAYRQAIHHRHAVVQAGANTRHWHETVLVRVETDSGHVGWGEGFGHFGASPVTLAALHNLIAPLCCGAVLKTPQALGAELERKLHPLGASGPVTYALSGLDIALWDVLGKARGQSISAMLAEQPATTLPAYASLIRYAEPDLVAEECRAAVSRGYGAVKLHETTAQAVRAASEVTKPRKLPLMVDVNCAWSVDEALGVLSQLRDIPLHWLEEPTWPPDSLSALGRLRQPGGPAIAVGENAFSRWTLAEMAATGVVDILQPSVTKLGGISGLIEVMRAAKTHSVGVAPHSPYFGPGLAATLHVFAALAPTAWIEHLFYDLETGPFGGDLNPVEGRFKVPQGPGLGVTPDLALLEHLRVAHPVDA